MRSKNQGADPAQAAKVIPLDEVKFILRYRRMNPADKRELVRVICASAAGDSTPLIKLWVRRLKDSPGRGTVYATMNC